VIISNTGYWQDNKKLYHVCCVPLCEWIIEHLSHQKSIPIYDLGCGNGEYSKRLHEAGFESVTGLEGKLPLEAEFNNIQEQDLTVPFVLEKPGNCVFLEVAEHIPAKFEDIMLTNIANSCSNNLIMSWAIRGQAGEGHVNCVDNYEAVAKIEAKGFKYLSEESISARNAIPDDNPYFWFKNTTLVFKKV